MKNQAHIDALAASIENRTCPMAVVDYAGMRDGDGPITKDDEPRRRYGTRDMRHVAIYKFTTLHLNKAAREAA